MGYETQIQFVDVMLRKDALVRFLADADEIIKRGQAGMLRCMTIDTSSGYLDWNLSTRQRGMLRRHTGDPLIKPTLENLRNIKKAFLQCWIDDEKDPIGRWGEADSFVPWLANYCCYGRVIETSQEGDGAVWGWEFGRKGVRELGIVPISDWSIPRSIPASMPKKPKE
jgi:hypothetical protein